MAKKTHNRESDKEEDDDTSPDVSLNQSAQDKADQQEAAARDSEEQAEARRRQSAAKREQEESRGPIPKITTDEIIKGEKESEKELREEQNRRNRGVEPTPPSGEEKKGVIGSSQFAAGEEILSPEEREVRRQEKAREESERMARDVKEEDQQRFDIAKARAGKTPVEDPGPINPETGEPVIPEGTPQPENRDEVPTGTQDSIPGPDSKLP